MKAQLTVADRRLSGEPDLIPPRRRRYEPPRLVATTIEEMTDAQIRALITMIDGLVSDDVGDARRLWSFAHQRNLLLNESERRRCWLSRELREWWYGDEFDNVAIMAIVGVCAVIAGWLNWGW